MRTVDLMIFDLDGTLITSGGDIAASVNHTLWELGLPVIEEATIMKYIGDGVQKLVQRSLGAQAPEKFAEALEIFSRHYAEHMLDTTTLYPGVIETLNHFKDKKRIVLTNKRHRFAASICAALDLEQYFDEILGADSTPFMKPEPRLGDLLLKRFNALPQRTVMIGDGVNDILFAQNAGLISCAFLSGLTDRRVLLDLKPDYSCERLTEMNGLFS